MHERRVRRLVKIKFTIFPIKLLESSCNLPNFESELHSFANLKYVNGYLIWESTRQWNWIYCCAKSNYITGLNKTRTSEIEATCCLWSISLLLHTEKKYRLKEKSFRNISFQIYKASCYFNLWLLYIYRPIYK